MLNLSNRIGIGAFQQFQQRALSKLILLFGFWSKDPETDYYASLEDGEPYYSLTEK